MPTALGPSYNGVMTCSDPEELVRRLAADSLDAGSATGWFERLYAAAAGERALVPWDRRAPHRLLVQWAAERGVDGRGQRALVVGCGYGDDAEYVAALGFETTAFDVSATAIAHARLRFPASGVHYTAADLLDRPAEWRGAFDLVIESQTIQSMPDGPRGTAIASVAGMVAPGGTLLVIALARPREERAGGPPWPLTRSDVQAFAGGGLELIRVERIPAPDGSPARHWRAEFRRP